MLFRTFRNSCKFKSQAGLAHCNPWAAGPSAGVKITIKPALTKINSQRNTALRKAGDILKALAQKGDRRTSGKEIKVNLNQERNVTVDGVPAFSQDPTDLRGSFLPPFNDLRIP